SGPLLEQQAGEQEGGQRNAGVEQGDVDRRGTARGGIEQRVVGADAQGGDHQQAPAGLAQGVPVAPEGAGHERQQDAQRQGPAPERQGQRGNLTGDGTPDQGVARPEQTGEQQAAGGPEVTRRHETLPYDRQATHGYARPRPGDGSAGPVDDARVALHHLIQVGQTVERLRGA